MMVEVIKSYYQKRSQAVFCQKLSDVGRKLSNEAEQMGKKHFISEFEKDEFIDKARSLKNQIMIYYGNKDIDELLQKKLNLLDELQIDKLFDCKKAGDLISQAGVIYQRQQKNSMSILPLGDMYLTYYEFIAAGAVTLLIMLLLRL